MVTLRAVGSRFQGNHGPCTECDVDWIVGSTPTGVRGVASGWTTKECTIFRAVKNRQPFFWKLFISRFVFIFQSVNVIRSKPKGPRTIKQVYKEILGHPEYKMKLSDSTRFAFEVGCVAGGSQCYKENNKWCREIWDYLYNNGPDLDFSNVSKDQI